MKDGEETVNWKVSALVIALILLAAGGIAAYIFSTEPTAQRTDATKKTAMLVEVVDAERGDFRPRIVAQGTVQPSHDVELQSQVGGRVVEISPAFTPGGFVEAGEVLLRIEPADFEFELAQRRSDLREALRDLAIEEGRHEVARTELEIFDDEAPVGSRSLVLRRPQLQAARERVRAARASVDQAKLNVARATVEAPFDAHILRRDVNVGSQVSPDDPIARLVGIDEYWVSVELPLSKLQRVTVAGEGRAGSEVRVRNPQVWPEGAFRTGHLFRLVGALDEDTRMTRVLAAIPDPLARRSDAAGKPPLVIGQYVEVTIQGDELEGVVRLARDYVRDDDTVWLMRDGRLQVQEVDIAARDAEHAYIRAGLEDGAKVVTTNISSVVEGAALRLEGAAPREEAALEEAADE